MNLKINGTVEQLTCVLQQMGDCGMLSVFNDDCSFLPVLEGMGIVIEDDVVLRVWKEGDGRWKTYEEFDYCEILLMEIT